jgi:phosphoribosylformylglycinamidine (FGAM) synthase-like amidotransferase family enzyme
MDQRRKEYECYHHLVRVRTKRRNFLSEFLQDEFTTFLVSCGSGIIPYPKTKYSYAGEH